MGKVTQEQREHVAGLYREAAEYLESVLNVITKNNFFTSSKKEIEKVMRLFKKLNVVVDIELCIRNELDEDELPFNLYKSVHGISVNELIRVHHYFENFLENRFDDEGNPIMTVEMKEIARDAIQQVFFRKLEKTNLGSRRINEIKVYTQEAVDNISNITMPTPHKTIEMGTRLKEVDFKNNPELIKLFEAFWHGCFNVRDIKYVFEKRDVYIAIINYNIKLIKTLERITLKEFKPDVVFVKDVVQEVLRDREIVKHHPKFILHTNIKNYKILFDADTLYWILMRFLSNAEHAVETKEKNPTISLKTVKKGENIAIVCEHNGMSMEEMAVRERQGAMITSGQSKPNIDFICANHKSSYFVENRKGSGARAVLLIPEYVEKKVKVTPRVS